MSAFSGSRGTLYLVEHMFFCVRFTTGIEFWLIGPHILLFQFLFGCGEADFSGQPFLMPLPSLGPQLTPYNERIYHRLVDAGGLILKDSHQRIWREASFPFSPTCFHIKSASNLCVCLSLSNSSPKAELGPAGYL